MIDGRSERLARLRDRRGSSGDWSGWYLPGAILLFIVMIVVTIGLVAPSYFERHSVTTHVVSKENVCKSNGDNGTTCEYLIFTDNGTFKISDAIFGVVRFNSSDVYGKVREDHDYTITYYGWRIPVLSTYPNIEKIEPVEG